MRFGPPGFGGWGSAAAYAAAWAHVQCIVCGRFGFVGEQDFEMVIIGLPFSDYAHGSCETLGKIFPDMRECPEYRQTRITRAVEQVGTAVRREAPRDG